jgi:alpha-L-fucosidase
MVTKSILCLILTIIFISSCKSPRAEQNYLNESKQQKDERMTWWRDARFGMFIHWGLYAVPAGKYNNEKINETGEWVMNSAKIRVAEYEKYAAQFNPVKYDADEWVKLAKAAGMKYIVITSKHHDGFSLWDSKVSDYDIMDATPYKKDILMALKNACDKYGLRLCFYHSIMDWHHPDAQSIFYPNYNETERSNPGFANYVENYMKPQLKELVENYGKLGILWFDGEWIKDWTSPIGKDLYNYVRNLQPDIIINNRVDKGRQGMSGLDEEGNFAGDYGTPEQEIPDTGLPGVDWESCMTMNDTWGYKSYDNNWKSSTMLIQNLVDIASKGGNYLLNVGPTAQGLIPEASVERLQDIGKWMDVNSAAIHGTNASPFEQPEWGRYTQKPGKLFAIIFDLPVDGNITIDKIIKTLSRVYLLSDNEQTALKVEATREGLHIHIAESKQTMHATVIVVEYDGKLQDYF